VLLRRPLPHWALTSRSPLVLGEAPLLSPFSFDCFYVEGSRLSVVESLLNLIAKPLKFDLLQPIVIVKQSQSFTDDFARRIVKAGRHFLPDYLFKL
jgi:hypothetical protein